MSWWKDGIPVQGTKNGTKPGLHGGFLSFVELTLDVTEKMNEEVYTCQARNNQMDRSIHDATTLDVLCEYYIQANRECIGDENQRDIGRVAATRERERERKRERYLNEYFIFHNTRVYAVCDIRRKKVENIL